jgi:hypothetical protein
MTRFRIWRSVAERTQHRTKKKSAEERTQFTPPEELIAENAGYVVWKDSKVVIFYTNDLASTPSRAVLDGTDQEAIDCVHGLAPVWRWTGTETMNRSMFMVPAIIVAYNKYMNGVDRLDQKRATNPTRRKEKRLYMSLFTYILDLAALQAHAVFQAIRPNVDTSFVEFKRMLCEDLVTPHRNDRKRPLPSDENGMAPIDEVLGSIDHLHMLIENINKADIHCFFCLLENRKRKTIYGCVKCKKGYHVNCFTAYHCAGALTGDAAVLASMIRRSEAGLPRAANKKSKCVGDITSIKLAR